MRLIFAGTSSFAVPALNKLLETEHDVVGVYTQPDKRSGRGRKIRTSPVKEFALQHKLPVLQPRNLDNEHYYLLETKPELVIVVSYGVILPQHILNIPDKGCLNIHASLLPRWRGAAPIQRAIESGDERTGVTLMQVDQGLDTGDILLQSSIPINKADTYGSLHEKLAQLGAITLIDVLRDIADGKTKATKQNHSEATYAKKVTKEESWINWDGSAKAIVQKICAFNPKPIARTMLDDKVILLLIAHEGPETKNAPPGTIIRAQGKIIQVQANDGTVNLTMVQLAGSRAMKVCDFLNGFSIDIGQKFESGDNASS
ncbi:MAG: methionyl-tRNA formyltransferase [Acidiferrobacteraceae bacterium]|nr:methionyl-tRNA formyltransferase [Acidiferrobacteraceae bacterium]